MDLPVMPPVSPMLAKPVDAIPTGDFIFEPKWDGFRSIVFRDGDEVEIGSRNERPMTRYFPELVSAFLSQLPPRCVIDGEIVLPDWDSGRLDFEALQLRLHPAESRVRLLAAQTPAHFVAFDLLALGDTSFVDVPFGERRAALEAALASADPPVHLTPATMDNSTAAEWFSQFEGAGLDGLIAKPRSGGYAPDKRVMFKIKHDRTADCVVAGYRPHKTGDDAVGSLLLGLYRDSGELASVGVVGALPMSVRRELRAELDPLVTTFDGHPWNWAGEQAGTRTPRSSQYSRWNVGKDLSFVPLRPERVLEVRYDHMEGTRFRHTAQFVRWRPDRTPASCTFSQLEEPVSYSLSEILSQDQLFRTDRGDCGGGCEDRRRGGGALGERVQSGEGVLSPDRAHQARPGAVLPGGRGRGAARGGRAADGAEAVRERGRGGAVLPEAGAELAAGLDLHRRAALPVRAHGRRGGADRRGRAGVGGQPRVHRPEPASGARLRPRPSR
jgi:ATP-dependent DNA ligase